VDRVSQKSPIFDQKSPIFDQKSHTSPQSEVMWTEYHKRPDAKYLGWINLTPINTTHCVKLGLMRVQESYIHTFTAQVAAPGLFGGFSFHDLKKLKVGDS